MKAEELRAWRRRQQMSQNALADLLGYVRQTIGYWEDGSNPIPIWLPLALRGIDATHDVVEITVNGRPYVPQYR